MKISSPKKISYTFSRNVSYSAPNRSLFSLEGTLKVQNENGTTEGVNLLEKEDGGDDTESSNLMSEEIQMTKVNSIIEDQAKLVMINLKLKVSWTERLIISKNILCYQSITSLTKESHIAH